MQKSDAPDPVGPVGQRVEELIAHSIDAPVLAIEAALVAILNVIVVVHILEQKQAYSRRPTSSPSSDGSLPVL